MADVENKVTRKPMIPLNLQFFAEGGNDPAPASDPTNGNDPAPAAPNNNDPANQGGSEEVTIEGLVAQMAELRAQNSKLKNDNDKLCTSEGNLRKQLRAKQTAEEQEAEAKAEADAQKEQHVRELERFQAVTLASERYVGMGMPLELAKATAGEEVDGHMETVTANITKFMAERDKKRDEDLRQKYLDMMPNPQSGNNAKVDYSQEFNRAMSDGDSQSAALAILKGSNFGNGGQAT